MKKTQKLLSLVVVLALALSVCAISASAASIVASTTIDENIVTATFDGGATDGTANTFYNNAGTATVTKQNAATLENGALKLTGRTIYNLETAITAGKYSLAFKVMTPDTNPSAALNIFRFGPVNDFHGYNVVSTVSGGKDTLTAYGVTTTLEPNVWYDMETIIDVDNMKATSYIEGVVVYEGSMKSAAIGRLFDVPVSGRTLYYDDIVFNKITQNVIEDGVTNVMYEDFSSKTSITSSTRFTDASGSTNFNKASDACSNVSVVDGTMLVGTRYILNPDPALNSGTYTVSFDFKVPTQETGANTYIFNAQNGTSGGFGTLLHYPKNDGQGHIWVNNASAMAVNAEQWYAYDATFDFATKEYVVTIDDKVVQSGTFTATQFTRFFQATQNNGHAVYYDNIVINKITKEYDVMSVTKENSTIKARFVNNAAPKATFFAAIYENGVLTSLKAISNVENLAERTVGTYSAADADVEVKFYTWAKNGLMPLAAVK